MTAGRAYVGVDPGMSGAFALIRDQLVVVVDMPTYMIDGKRKIDHNTLSNLLWQWAEEYYISHATIERVHAMPGQGVTSTFNFGLAYGAAVQACAHLDTRFVHPATWKAIYGLRGGRENKNLSRDKASELFPLFRQLWARAKDDGRAEAVLLAHYGRNMK
jgi:hypothetical protein